MGTANSANLALAAGDAIKFTYDGATLRLLRKRAGAEAVLYGLSWSNQLTAEGCIYAEMNLGGLGGELTLDNVIFYGVTAGDAIAYDSFSSGDLSKWAFTPGDPQRTEPAVSGGLMTWGKSATPGYGLETLVSTKSTFDLAATTSNVIQLQFDVAGIVQKLDDGYDTFGFGWKDSSGNLLIARLYWTADGAANESIYRFYYNGAQLATANSANLALADGDQLKFSYDGVTLKLLRGRAGSDAVLFSKAWVDASFGDIGSLYMEMTIEGTGSEIAFDNIIHQPFVPDSEVPPVIISLNKVSGDVFEMVINALAPEESYLKGRTNLSSGAWGSIGHSIDGNSPFVITNLSYSAISGENHVIYVQAVGDIEFFKIDVE